MKSKQYRIFCSLKREMTFLFLFFKNTYCNCRGAAEDVRSSQGASHSANRRAILIGSDIPPQKVSFNNHLLESAIFRFRSIQIQVYCLKYRRKKFLVQQNSYINKKQMVYTYIQIIVMCKCSAYMCKCATEECVQIFCVR